MERKTYTGYISEHHNGDHSDALYLTDHSYPIAEEIEGDIAKKIVTARYWITDVKRTKEQLKEDTLLSISGALEAEYAHAYSEMTGYLWTDENLKIGGHDLLEEIRSNIGKYIHLEIDIH